MIGVLLAVLCAAALVVALSFAGIWRQKSALPTLILGGYVLRLLMQLVVRQVQFFTHEVGGDSGIYEYQGRYLALLWQQTGLHYVASDDKAFIGATSLPANLFGLVIYLNDGDGTRLGCTALVALAAGLTALNLYTLGVEFKAEPRNAMLFAAIIYFEPAFLFYTCDMYKDGLVLCFVLGALGSALRLGNRWSLLHAVIGVICLWALWYVRFYLVFATLAPLVVGLVGFGTKSTIRTVITAIILVFVAVALASFTDILQTASERANETFDIATSVNVTTANRQGGSGVEFDDGGSAYGALPMKLAYTLFSPFPWQGGSLGFQLGKVDAVLWYFIVYRAVAGAWQALKRGESRLVVMLLSFIVPCTFMYAMTMANVGLIMRQRLVIVAATAIFAAIYKPTKKKATRSTNVVRRVPRNVTRSKAVV